MVKVTGSYFMALCFCALLLSETPLAITDVQASGDPDAASASDDGAGSAADRQSGAARSSGPASSSTEKQRVRPDAGASDSRSGDSGSSRDGASQSRENEALVIQRPGASETEGAPRQSNGQRPSPGSNSSSSSSLSPAGPAKKPNADSDAAAKNNALNAQRSGADGSSRAPDALAQLPSASDNSSSSSPVTSLQPGAGVRKNGILNGDSNSLSEFIETYWLWLLIPLALALFGLAKFLTRGGAET